MQFQYLPDNKPWWCKVYFYLSENLLINITTYESSHKTHSHKNKTKSVIKYKEQKKLLNFGSHSQLKK